MSSRRVFVFFCLVTTISLVGCGEKDEPSQPAETPVQPCDAVDGALPVGCIQSEDVVWQVGLAMLRIVENEEEHGTVAAFLGVESSFFCNFCNSCPFEEFDRDADAKCEGIQPGLYSDGFFNATPALHSLYLPGFEFSIHGSGGPETLLGQGGDALVYRICNSCDWADEGGPICDLDETTMEGHFEIIELSEERATITLDFPQARGTIVADVCTSERISW